MIFKKCADLEVIVAWVGIECAELIDEDPAAIIKLSTIKISLNILAKSIRMLKHVKVVCALKLVRRRICRLCSQHIRSIGND